MTDPIEQAQSAPKRREAVILPFRRPEPRRALTPLPCVLGGPAYDPQRLFAAFAYLAYAVALVRRERQA